jgi:hypothetical protein
MSLTYKYFLCINYFGVRANIPEYKDIRPNKYKKYELNITKWIHALIHRRTFNSKKNNFA